MYPTIIDFGPIQIGPISFPLGIRSYGLMLALAFITGMLMLRRELVRKKLEPQVADSIILAGAVGGIVGAKLYSAMQDGAIEIAELFSTSGLVWYGGLIGGTAAALFTIYKSPNPILPTLDAIGPLLLLGYGIGRVGCFLSGDGDYGQASDLPWAMAFPNGTVPTEVPVHPTPIYETVMSCIGFGLLWRIRKQQEKIPGRMFGASLSLAGLERFLAEFWRLNPRGLFGLTTAQFTSILMVAIGGVVIYWATYRPMPAEAPSIPTPPPSQRWRKRRRRS
jgi:phosphatidylglycerol:prolipoprotein diacylglycerol transferase